LFEAGALSKSIDKSHVCPILFGVSPADIEGPLKQFQLTSFDKGDLKQLLTTLNGRLQDGRIAPKTLETIFDKWWPDLLDKVSNILGKQAEPAEPIRNDRELLEEMTWTPKTEPVLMRASLPARMARRSPMKRKRHNPEQIIRKLRTAEQLLNQGQSVADVCRALEVSAPTYHRWQQLYGGMKATEAKRLKELEQENTRLKRLLADAELDKAMLKELAEGNF
jgi:transposase-like protein